ncbi:MAG: patatin-like phospholipase family protein [Desulfosarcina sp.]
MARRLPCRPTLFFWSIIQVCAAITAASADVLPQRAAIAISGGASKGAYEAGLNWGIIEIARKVEQTGYLPLGGTVRPIEAAGIAGTSAGGINTLLSALAWCVLPESQGGFANRIDDNIFREIWLLPDVNQLLPSEADSPLYLPGDALLSRKQLVEGSRALRNKWRRAGTFPPGMRIPLGVSVTRVEPEILHIGGIEVKNQRFYIPFEMRTQTDGSAAFFFDPGDYPLFRNPDLILLPNPADTGSFKISDQQVEDVILTTSAFPMGFGRRQLHYCRQADLATNQGTGGETGKGPNSVFACPEGYVLSEAEFADGGLFDNLPIGLARRLSESGVGKNNKPLPVNYIYLDPNRERFQKPQPEQDDACSGDSPPEACRTMPHNLTSEAAVLGGALGTARKVELYRELTSDDWRLNFFNLSNQVAERLEKHEGGHVCHNLLPYFDRQLDCADQLRQAARLLELSYDYSFAPISAPFSVQSLLREQIVTACRPSSAPSDLNMQAECGIDAPRLRKALAAALKDAIRASGEMVEETVNDIRVSEVAMDSDRIIRVTSRGAPITGTLLDDFGAFLDYKFREYDYYVGIYDAVVFLAGNQCAIGLTPNDRSLEHRTCFDHLSQAMYRLLGVADDSKARYVFALLARKEFGSRGLMTFAYAPMPTEDRDLHIIHDALGKSLTAGRGDAGDAEGALSVEREFFDHLKAESFKPTVQGDGSNTLLALIMDDPEYWPHELVNRVTSRLVYLEGEAERIYQTREPDPVKRGKAYPTLMGTGALSLRTATYQYPNFAFAPSTAPESWLWRNIIPYEASFDTAGGDLSILWQPTWNFNRDNLGIRFGFGFAGGLFDSRSEEKDYNYGTLGLDFTHLTHSALISGWGVTPAVYHSWVEPEDFNQTTLGVDLHALFLNNRFRVGVGVRDIIDDAGDTWFLTIGIADLPGLWYWLTR